MTIDPLKVVEFAERSRPAKRAYRRNASETWIRKLRSLKKWNPGGLALPFMLLSSPVMAASFAVTSLSDSGPGSLRAAITSANANRGSTITFGTTGTITLSTPLPGLVAQMAIDGTTAPGFVGTPLVSVDFNTGAGLTVAVGADGTSIKSLALVHAQTSAVTLLASNVTLQGNYIGLGSDGIAAGNLGDGVTILGPSGNNLIGNSNPVAGITYANANAFPTYPVSAWQGIRNNASVDGEFLICGTSNALGLLYVGPISGAGTSFTVNYPGATATSVYGPDNLAGGKVRLVGSYRKSGASNIFNYGFVWEGATNQLPSDGVFGTIAYPGAVYQFTHSTMGTLAVGNADGPKQVGDQTLPIGPGVAYIYDLSKKLFVTNIVFPSSKSDTAYGIWQNGPTNYTICGGYSPLATNNLTDQSLPLTQGKAFLVDYESATNTFSNWTSFDYPLGPVGVNFITHFEGISSIEPGVYSVNADSVQAGSSNPVQGSWVSVRRNSDGTFDKGTWVNLNFPNSPGSIASSNSVYGYQVVGLVADPNVTPSTFPFQATVDIDFQLSNVISCNKGNGITISGSTANIVAMNNIGTDPAGGISPDFGNALNGILITGASAGNLIGGQAAGINNPTGSKKPVNAVFQRPPQGNLISGNLANGVLINGASIGNLLSGNFIGTDADGTSALGNGLDGVVIDTANNNSLIGCTFYQNPFVFYNVIAGNHGNGLRINNSDNVTVQANFLGMGADNATSVPNQANGLLVAGTSLDTQVGGVIPLGNVISGNALNGILVRDTVSGFITFNTFGGIAAFQTAFTSPNGLDGILITSTGGNNTVRTNIFSGNNGNGIEIGGNASGVQVTDTSAGTNTAISGPMPNLGSGIVLRGEAHNNSIGGFQPSVEPTVFASGNKRYGIAVMDRAYNNTIFHSMIGLGTSIIGNFPSIPNLSGGILLGAGTSGTTIGGPGPLQNLIQRNNDAGLSIYSSTENTVLNNNVQYNGVVGIYAVGVCTGTSIQSNTVLNNPPPSGTTNVVISGATGISFAP